MDPLKMYFLVNMGIFQPAMLVYQRVSPSKEHDFIYGPGKPFFPGSDQVVEMVI